MIIIYCDGGLANRINSLISGIALSEILNTNHIIVWPKNNRCNAAFEDIFIPYCLALKNNVHEFVPYEHTLSIWMHENDCGFKSTLPNLRGITDINTIQTLNQDRKKLILFSENSILPWLPQDLVNNALSNLLFQPNIISIASKLLDQRAIGSYFGIHLRGTDFLPPPPVEQMLDIVATNPQYAFFICSDDPTIEDRFSMYPNVFLHRKTAYVKKLIDAPWRHAVIDSDGLPYTSNIDRTAESVIQACVDLLLLAASTPIRNSASSFFNLAEHLRESGLISRELTNTPSS